MTARDQSVREIARRVLHVTTLEPRHSDAADFHDLAVWTLREALEAAYDAGRAAGAREAVRPGRARASRTRRVR